MSRHFAALAYTASVRACQRRYNGRDLGGLPFESAVEFGPGEREFIAARDSFFLSTVSETGWPDQGSAFHGAVPSVQGAMRYFLDTQQWAQRDGVEVFWFAAFDEAWKVGAEGDVGAYWGLWDKDGRPKFG